MNTYEAFYKDKRISVQASTSYEAQQKAAAQFKAKKSHDVTVMLAMKGDEAVMHDGAELP